MSASIISTFLSLCASTVAKFTEMNDLPTPGLGPEIAITLFFASIMAKGGSLQIKKVKGTHSLDEIDPTLWVTSSITAIIHTIDKEFSLSANYPKGHGDLFLEWMQECHQGKLLLHVKQAAGLRQDLCTEGSLAIFMNYPYYVKFLDEVLRKKRTKVENTSILQQSLFVVLTYTEMIALSRLLSIIHLSICMPF